ncbi:16S rRNA (guanine(527)-N(7))-methyltransferase RsmG [Rapidithrix thailandica]|uniref:Ribosomal RNA small subunit methyltransferase G n=1 Tax=Rapidithrix thailandica TaxID=413964 RepID=A0AAW9S3T6_9BACT
MEVLLKKYFPEITQTQLDLFKSLPPLYAYWNEKVNVISRRDVENLTERHILHSLSIAKIFPLAPGTRVLDVGTGGGFPGIPLAIFYPEAQFHLVDSIGKKIKVVEEIAKTLELSNVTAEQIRAEKLTQQYDLIVSRAVTRIDVLHRWTKKLIRSGQANSFKNGILCLKGGDLKEEFAKFKNHHRFYPLKEYFEEEFFETKKLVYVPV